MSSERKVRADAVLKTLPRERQQTIYDKLQTETLAQVREWLRSDGVKVSSQTLSEFYSWFSLRQTFEETEADTLNFLELARRERPELSEEDLTSLGNLHFNLQAIKLQDPKLFLAMQTARHKARMDRLKFEQREREIALSARKVEALERKIAKAQAKLDSAVKSAREGGLTAESLKRIEEAARIL